MAFIGKELKGIIIVELLLNVGSNMKWESLFIDAPQLVDESVATSWVSSIGRGFKQTSS